MIFRNIGVSNIYWTKNTHQCNLVPLDSSGTNGTSSAGFFWFFLVPVVFGSGGYFGSDGFYAGLRFWFRWFGFGSGGLNFSSGGLKPQR